MESDHGTHFEAEILAVALFLFFIKRTMFPKYLQTRLNTLVQSKK